jgi:DNA-binding transcriptional MerR regulator
MDSQANISVSAKTEKSETAFRTISEVAEELGVQQHVLRFWETKFSQVKPMKRGGGRRYYRPEDVALLKKIHSLLYVEGYTIKGVQKLLKGISKSQVMAEQKAPKVEPSAQAHGAGLPQVQGPDVTSVSSEEISSSSAVQEAAVFAENQKEILRSVLEELLEMRAELAEISGNRANADAA